MGREAQNGGHAGARAAAGASLSALLQELARAPESPMSAWDGALRAGAVIDGRFELVRELGRGGFGLVWEARDAKLGRSVAFKALRVAGHVGLREERLLREADVAARLTHPNIVTLHDVGRSEHGPYIVMELLRGQTLAKRIGPGVVPVPEALRIGIEIAKGVAHAHGEGVVHRDLKPGNVFLAEDGQVKILDFGLAHAFGTPTIGGGTPGYMAPEQWRGAPEDERSDVFALGVILHRMLSGGLPFPDDALASQGLAPAPALEVEDAPQLGELVSRMLERDPLKRPRDAGEVLPALTAVQRAIDSLMSRGAVARVQLRPRVPAEELATAPGLPGGRRKRRFAWPAAVIGIALGVAAAFFAPGLGGRDRPPQLPAEKRLAVLPFENDGGGQDEAAFSAGLREIVTNALFQLDDLASWRFVSASEVLREKVTSVKEARASFGATLALEGTVRWRPDRVMVTANLVDTSTAVVLTARSFDVQRGEAAALQKEFVDQIADMLQVKLKPEARSKLASERTPAPRAYEFYSQGRGYLQRYDRTENLDSAITVFDHALALDPAYALAHAGKAEAYLRRYEDTKDPSFLELARASARRALELGERLAPVQLTMGLIEVAAGEHDEAIRRFMRGLELEPRNADAYRELANAYDASGRQKDAEATYLRAIDLRPDSWAAYKDLAIFHFRHDRPAQALPLFQRVVDLTPDNYAGYANLGATYFLLARHEEAARALERSLALRPTDHGYANLGTVYYYQQRYREAGDSFRKAVELNPTESEWWGSLGDADRWAGQPDAAADDYRRAVELLQKQLSVNARDADAWARLATHRAALGQREKGLADIGKALSVAPKDGQVLFRAALVYEQAGLRARALEAIRAAIAAGYAREAIDKAPPFEELRRDPRYAAAVAGPPKGPGSKPE